MIRPASPNNRQAIINLLYASYQSMCHQHNLHKLSELTTKQAIIDEVLQPINETWLINHKSQLSGVLSIQKNTIERLFISPNQQALGLGKKLLEFAIAKIQANQFPHAKLEVLADNIRARNFYQNQGWVASHHYTLTLRQQIQANMIEYHYLFK